MTVAENPDRSSFVLLQVGERRFALPSNIVTELAPPVRLHTFPHTSPLVAGVIVRRGQIVPVYEVAPTLLGTESPTHRFYLIAQRKFGKSSEASAIPLNGECELATAEIKPPADGRPGYISGTLEIGDESVELLNLEALVTHQSPGERDAPHSEAKI
ncbi:MAG: chemotaxis protein CheW [Candidatus Acidiferrales bacterium]